MSEVFESKESQSLKFSTIGLIRKPSNNTDYTISINRKCNTCPVYGFTKTCPVTTDKTVSTICNHNNGLTCIAVRDGYDIGKQLLKLQKVGFLDPNDFIEKDALVKIITQAKQNVK